MGSRYLAEHIAGARHVVLPGSDHSIAAGDTELPLREIEWFLEEVWEERAWEDFAPERVLATGSSRTSSAPARGRPSSVMHAGES